MVYWTRMVYLMGVWLFLAGVLFEVFLAGLGLFAAQVSWDVHQGFGFLGGPLILILIVLAFLGRFPRATVGLTVLLLGLYMIQILLVAFGGDAPVIAALHPVNALALFWVALALERRARALARPPIERSAV